MGTLGEGKHGSTLASLLGEAMVMFSKATDDQGSMMELSSSATFWLGTMVFPAFWDTLLQMATTAPALFRAFNITNSYLKLQWLPLAISPW